MLLCFVCLKCISAASTIQEPPKKNIYSKNLSLPNPTLIILKSGWCVDNEIHMQRL